MKRFWTTATVTDMPGGAAILLDGKPMRVPGGPALLLTAPALADAVAAEWQAAGGAAGGTFTLDDLPLTRLAGTAQDRVAPNPGSVASALAEYAQSDLLCYRATHPAALASRQGQYWQPWLDWAAVTHGARLEPTEGIIHRAQDPAALAQLAAAYAALDPAALAALGIAVPAMGSAVLGLAMAAGELDAVTAFEVSSLDELFQVEQWGEDSSAVVRRAHVAADLALAERFLRLTR